MSEQSYQALPPEDHRPLAWHQVWIRALTQPTEDNYINLLERDPDVGVGKAFGWIALAALIGGAVVFVAFLLFNLIPLGFLAGEDILPTFGGSAIALICVVPVVIIIAVIAFALYSAIIQAVARILGGVGTYGELTYAFAAYGAPLYLVSMILSPIPYLGACLSTLLAIYAIVLNVIAVKAVHRFDWGRAIITSLSLVILSLIFACCLIIAVSAGLVAIAPELDNMFPELMRQIELGTF